MSIDQVDRKIHQLRATTESILDSPSTHLSPDVLSLIVHGLQSLERQITDYLAAICRANAKVANLSFISDLRARCHHLHQLSVSFQIVSPDDGHKAPTQHQVPIGKYQVKAKLEHLESVLQQIQVTLENLKQTQTESSASVAVNMSPTRAHSSPSETRHVTFKREHKFEWTKSRVFWVTLLTTIWLIQLVAMYPYLKHFIPLMLVWIRQWFKG